MVATAQHIRNGHAAEVGGAGVVRVFQKECTVAFLHQGIGGPHRAGQQAHNTVDHRHRRQLTTGEDEITHRHLLIGQAANPFVEALVVTAEEDQLIVVGGPTLQICLLEGTPLR